MLPEKKQRNNSRKNEETETKQNQHSVVDVTGDGRKVQCYKEQYCIGTGNIRSMNQGSYAILFFTEPYLTSITSYIHNQALFSLWLCLFIIFGVISPLFSSSKLGTYWLGSLSFSVISLCLFILSMKFSRQKYWSSLPFLSSGPLFVRILHHDPPILSCPTWHGS